MPVTVTVTRGTPLAWPIAALFTVVGAALVIVGFTVIPAVEPTGGGGGSDVILDAVAVLLIVPTWILYLLSLIRGFRSRRQVDIDVPHELPEPPSVEDPAIVGAVIGKGHASGRTVAATVLGLASSKVLDIAEHGDQVVIDLPGAAAPSDNLTPTDQMVLESLRSRADAKGDVVGPPIWPKHLDWWRDYARDARNRAMLLGLVEPRVPLVGLMLVGILTATGLALIFFWHIAAFVGFILLANGLPHLIARASGYRLSIAGRTARAQWIAFGRYIHGQQSLRDVGPAGVAVWGPNLVYGVLVGEGDKAARMLAPNVGRDDPAPAELQQEFTTSL